jgi:hypothetical protein
LDKSGNLTPIIDGMLLSDICFDVNIQDVKSRTLEVRKLDHRDMSRGLLRLSRYLLKMFSEHTNVVHVRNEKLGELMQQRVLRWLDVKIGVSAQKCAVPAQTSGHGGVSFFSTSFRHLRPPIFDHCNHFVSTGQVEVSRTSL